MERKNQERAHPMEETAADLLPEDEAFWEVLSRRLRETDHPGLCLSEETVQLIESACPVADVESELVADLVEQLERTARDLEYEAELKRRNQEPSLGSYLVFLRSKAGLTASDAAKESDWEFQALTELERNRLRPQSIPAQPLAALLQRLRASCEMAERLLTTTIRAPRYQVAGARGSLYRGARGASGAASEAASLAARGEMGRRTENPEYREEAEAVARLKRELRAAWRSVNDR